MADGSVSYESAIRGLMLLGRTREDAAKEFREAERQREREILAEFWEEMTVRGWRP
jgi:hypothetical protein